jgi:hypothetical protein
MASLVVKKTGDLVGLRVKPYDLRINSSKYASIIGYSKSPGPKSKIEKVSLKILNRKYSSFG